MDSGIRSQSSFVYQVAPKDLVCIDLDDPDRVFFPGERITGTVRVGLKHGTPSRLAIHLACTAKLGSRHLPLFKIPLLPANVNHANTKIPFNIMVPGDVPSSVDHSRVPGKIEYKVKAVHEVADLPSCVWPKAAVVVRVHERISTLEDKYVKGMTSEGKISFHIPHDITLKHCSFRKGDIKNASAWLHITRSCYLPGQVIPFTLRIQHFAPIRQTDGVTAYLERITKTVCDMENSIDTVPIAQCTLPLSCDDGDFQTKFTCHGLKVPRDTPPTLDREQYPLQVSYRIRVVVNLDLDSLQLRKRDRVATYIGMIKMRFNEEELAGGSTIVLDIPLKIGTSDEDLPPSPHSISSFKSLFDGGFGFFQQDDRGMIPPSPMLGPPPAYQIAISTSGAPPASVKSSSSNNPTTVVTLRQLTPAYDPVVEQPPTTRYMDSKPPILSSPLQPPPSLLLLEGIPRQPSAPNLQDLESPIPIARTPQHRYSDNVIPDISFANKPTVHARSWSVPADRGGVKYMHHPSPQLPPPPPQYRPMYHSPPVPHHSHQHHVYQHHQ
ncbi:hypothetical protein BJV82DRAFT_39858 [Fennellomyces sp. T-0311]|nr:hypothetical protein BJV82DRAFT_39858 [Fennellomyces sp. T-0311]